MSSGQFPTNIEKDPSYFVATEADKYYLKSFSFPSGTYIINWPSSASVYFEIFDGDGSSLGSYGPSSGGLAYIGLNSKGEKIILKSDKAHTSIGIKRIPSSFMSNGMTLDTITSTQTYTQTGVGYAVLVGGGGGGSGSSGSGPSGGSGGGSGRVVKTGLITLTGNMSTVVGANGFGGSGGGSGGNGGAGGNTTFAGYTAQGGAAGLTNGGGNGGAGGGGGYQNFTVFVYYFTAFYRSGFSGGTGFTGSNGAAGIPNTVSYDHSGSGGAGGETTLNLGLPVKAGTTGGGCGGSYQGTTASGKGSGIGTGGAGGNNGNGGNAAGYGGGGGGAGGNTTYTGGAGSPGVVYILRGNLI